MNDIPPMTDPRSKYWKQPSTSEILIDDECAMMSEYTFNQLAEYSCTTPTGVYPGKMWKAKRGDKGYLRWYAADDGDTRGLPTPFREIVKL